MKKKFLLGGMIAGALIVVFGILAMCGVLGEATSYGNSSPYDSGFASFGADYYTYSANNSAETASAARATANNLCDISHFLQACCGLFMIGIGIAIFCGFGAVFADCCNASKNIIIEEESAEDQDNKEEDIVEENTPSEENPEEIETE